MSDDILETKTINGVVYKKYDFDKYNRNHNYKYEFDPDGYFSQFLITANDVPKFLIGAYSYDSWFDEEVWGSSIAILDTIRENAYHPDGKVVNVDGYVYSFYFEANNIVDVIEIINNEDALPDELNLYLRTDI